LSSQQRQGQLNLACAQCHDDNIGRKLAGIEMPQAHPTGYPLYRLEWQSLGSLQRRLRNCMIGIRAVASAGYAVGKPCGQTLTTAACAGPDRSRAQRHAVK